MEEENTTPTLRAKTGYHVPRDEQINRRKSEHVKFEV